MKVIKRNGKEVEFNKKKINGAILKAFMASGEEFKDSEVQELTEQVVSQIDQNKIEVEEIQDIVEDTLIKLGYDDIFAEYTTYRRKRAISRDKLGIKDKKFIKDVESITQSATDADLKRENANVDGDTPMGTMLQYGSTLSKQFANSYLLKPKAQKAHENGDIHIHDLDFYPMGTTTCLQIDLDKLYKGGFSTGHGYLREPKSIGSYAALAAIAIQANQNDQHGGQSIPMFDYYMAPGVLISFKKNLKSIISDFAELSEFSENGLEETLEKTKLIDEIKSMKDAKNIVDEIFFNKALEKTTRDTYQAMEGFIHNMNTMHSRAGAQVPFSSINFGTDTSDEGRMVIEQYLLALESGLGNHETPIFPISIFKVKEGVNYNEGEPNYDLFLLATRVSAKRMFPNFSFIDAPHNIVTYDPNDPNTEVSYMGCRTRVVTDITDEEQVVTSRGNVSFTTINLPRLAIEFAADRDAGRLKEGEVFTDRVKEKMDIVKEQLLDRLDYQSSKTINNFPFLLGEGNWKNSDKLKPGQSLRDVYKHGSLSIGFIGLAEALVALYGHHHGESDEMQNEGLNIIKFMRETCDTYSKEEQLNFTLLATPAEGLSGRFVAMDAKKYGVIPGITDREYYTNSFHVPVYYNIKAKDKINKEAPYHALTNAGHISYIELDGDLITNQEAFVAVIRMMKEAGIGYGAINHPLDRDPVCGFSGVIGEVCPGCNRTEADGVKFERIRRITGYLVGTTDRFNNAKQAEERDRVKHGR